MDSNWRPTPGADPTTGGVALGGTSTGAGGVTGGAEPIANPDWRSQLQPEARHRIVTKIMETLKRHLPVPVPEGLNELQKIAVRFEDKIYSAATSQPDYLRKISLKMLSMETKTQGPQINPASNPNLQNPNLQNPGLGNMQATSNPNPNPSQSLSMPQTSRQIPINPQQSPPVTSDIYSQRRQGNQIPGNQMPGNQIPGNQMPGNQIPGNQIPGNQIPGNQMTGNQMGGNQMPVNQNQMVYQQIMRQKMLQQQQMGNQSGGMTGGMQTGLNPLQQQQQQLQMQQNQMRQNQIQQNQLQQQNQMMNNNNMMVGAGGNSNNNGNNMNMSNNMNNMQQRRMMSQQNQNLLSQFQNQQPGGNNNNMNTNMNNTNNMNTNMNNNMMQLQQQQQRLQTQNVGNNMNNNMNNNVNNNNNVSEQQKQFMQQQRVIQDVASSPASMDSTAQTGSNELAIEEVYQKLKSMKELYYNDLREIYQRLSIKLNQIDPAFMGDPKTADQFEKMKNFKNALERFLSILQLNKSSLQHQVNMKEKLIMYEKQINNILQSHKKTPPQVPPAQQSQIPPGQQSDPPPQQIDNNHHIQQGNSNSNNNFVQNDPNSSNFNSMNPPQNVGTGTGTGTGMMMSSHNNMISQQQQQQQQTLNLKQQQEARMIQQNQLQQNQIKQRQLQMIQKQQLLQQQQQTLNLKQQNINNNNNQPSQIPNTDSLTDIKPRMKPGTSNPYQQPLYPSMNSSRTSYFHPNLKPGTGSPQIQSSLSPSPQVDQVKLERAHLHTNSPLQNVPSPLIPDETKPASNLHNNNSSPLVQTGQTGQVVQPSQSVQSIAVGTPGISASPLLAEFTSPEINGNNVLTQVNNVKSTVAETPIERLAKALRAGSNKQAHSSLRSAVTDIGSVVTLLDRVAGSAPGNGSRAAVGDDLVAMTRCRVQAKRLNNGAEGNGGNGGSVNKRVKRDTSAMPLNDDGEEEDNGSNGSDGEVMNHGLIEEIREINSRLIDTELTLNESESATSSTASSASSEGTVIKCIYTAVAISPGLRSHFASSQLSPILPLRLLVPSSYPKSSPIILDKLPEEQSRDFDDLSTKARSQFSACLRSLSEPLDLKEIARTWDICARNVILEYAVRIGGGSFSSGFGTWQNCVGA